MLLFQLADDGEHIRRCSVMSVVRAFSLVLAVGFGATALVGFLAWRERVRDGAGFGARQA
jgi:hypothetical protein